LSFRVLIVDDDDHVRGVLGRLLERRGYAVHTASGAESAYALLGEHTVDAVLMDLNMPEVPGEALFFALVARWPYLRGRIAIMSGNVAGLDDELPAEVSSCPRLAKPFTFEMLETVVAGIASTAARRKQNGG
jgi:DNA-binding NtrC family response regulator